MKILLIDDSRTMRNIQKKGLASFEPVEFNEAGDGLEALTVCAGIPDFDLVLVDWNMPNMDGITFVKKFREKNKTTPVIMVTTEAEKVRVIEAIKAGVNNYVIKPFTPEMLQEKVNQTFEQDEDRRGGRERALDAPFVRIAAIEGGPHMTTAVQLPLHVEIAPDAMEAFVPIDDAGILPVLDPEALAALASKAGVTPLDVEELRRAIKAFDVSVDPRIVVARGRKPVADQPARIELLQAMLAPTPEGVVPATPPQPKADGFYASRAIPVAKAGQVVAKWIAPVEGTDGVDVSGNAIPRKKVHGARLGDGVDLGKDGASIVAKVNGALRFEDKVLFVETTYRCARNVDFSTGSIDFPGDVEVRGNVLDLFYVRAGGNLSIGGEVEAAEIRAGGTLKVLGGVNAKDKGTLTAGGDLSVKYLHNASVKSGGDVTADVEISQSKVTCAGKLDASKAAVFGSQIIAPGGVVCGVLGATNGTKTTVEIGSDDALRQLATATLPEIERRRKQVEKTRAMVQPLMANPKKLTPQQKEKATELHFEADQLEGEITRDVQKLAAANEAANAKCSAAEIRVLRTLHPGVTVRIGDVQAVIDQPAQGPLRIQRTRAEHQTQIIVIPDGGRPRSLPIQEVSDGVDAALRKEMLKLKK